MQLLAEVGVADRQEVIDFLVADLHLGRVALVFAVGGADQGETLQVGNGEDDAAILVLQDERLLTLEQARHDDVAALDQADAIGRALLQVLADETCHPGAGGIDQRAGADRQQAAIGPFQMNVPQALAAPGADAAGAGMDVRAMLAGAHGVEYHQAGVVDPAVGVFEATVDLALERAARAEAHAARGRQLLALAQVIVEEQAGADHPGRAQVRAVGQDETQRLDDVRSLGQQHFAFGQGFAYQAELVVLQVAQAAVDQLAAGRGGVLCQIVLFAKEHRQAASGGIGRDAHAIDATADHRQVVDFAQRGVEGGLAVHGGVLVSKSIFEIAYRNRTLMFTFENSLGEAAPSDQSSGRIFGWRGKGGLRTCSKSRELEPGKAKLGEEAQFTSGK